MKVKNFKSATVPLIFWFLPRMRKKNGIEVRVQEDTVWLTQKAIGQLFDIDRSVVTKHLKKIFTDGELEENSTCAFFAQAARYGKYAVRPADEAERQECMERLKEAEGDIKDRKSVV